MKERPILMTAESVKAILAGRKTMTRRIIKPQPKLTIADGFYKANIQKLIEGGDKVCPYGQVGDSHPTFFKDNAPPKDGYYEVIWEVGDTPRLVYLRRHNEPDLPVDIPTEYEWERWLWGKDEQDDPEAISLDIRQPELIQWRRVGDRLWVRETWAIAEPPLQNECGDVINGSLRGYGIEYLKACELIHKATADDIELYKWRPSIFMPRWASRIERIIVLLRAERLLDISEADARAEGFNSIEEFLVYWDILNKKRGYGVDKNPWNWVIGW